MPSLGPAEILVILVIALLVFGPNKMPDIARQVGRGVREFRRVQQHLTGELRDVVSEFDTASGDAGGTPTTSAMGEPTNPAMSSAAPTPGGGDPVPTLPPRFDPPEPAPTPRSDDDDNRGQRVWPPPPAADA